VCYPLPCCWLFGCSGGGCGHRHLPNTAQTLEPSDAEHRRVRVNDSSHGGATFSLNGPGSMLLFFKSCWRRLMISETYTLLHLPCATTAVVTATSVNTPSQTASVTINLNRRLQSLLLRCPSGAVGTVYNGDADYYGWHAHYRWLITSGSIPG